MAAIMICKPSCSKGGAMQQDELLSPADQMTFSQQVTGKRAKQEACGVLTSLVGAKIVHTLSATTMCAR